MFYLNIHKLVGSKSARQFLYPLSFFKQKRNIAESNIPLGMFPFSIGLQKFKVHFPKRQEKQIARTSQLMHDEHAALTKHFARVSHQKIELDILGEISGYVETVNRLSPLENSRRFFGRLGSLKVHGQYAAIVPL